MPLQNRVKPDGEIVVSPARGLLMGNRGGRLHDPESQTLLRTQSSRQWITCVLQFKARQRQVMGHGYTELFFMDEVTALAVGHRPCFECRRRDALLFQSAWQTSHALAAPPKAPEMDRVLSGERRAKGGAKITWSARPGCLPDGAMVRFDGGIFAVHGSKFLPWTASGYGSAIPLDLNIEVEVLTPPTIARILHAGYQPIWHQSAKLAGDKS